VSNRVLIPASSKARWYEACAATAHNYHDNNDCGSDGGDIVGDWKELDICKLGELVSKQKVFFFEPVQFLA
jgi:hypothetical protein